MALDLLLNLPIGLIALAVITTRFQAQGEQVRHRIDYVGTVLLSGGLSAIVLYTSLGGTTYLWTSDLMIVLVALGVILLAAFMLAETRAAEPILPLALFRNRVFSVAGALSFILGGAVRLGDLPPAVPAGRQGP